jgi:hypothetical protein
LHYFQQALTFGDTWLNNLPKHLIAVGPFKTPKLHPFE